jgi:hypothetical protein
LIALLTLTGPNPTRPTEDGCFKYDSDVAKLNGTISTHVFPGPPNYESVAKGDAREQVWVLQLSKPICTSASADIEAEKDVRDLQLVFREGQKQYDEYRSLKGRRVVVTGTLFHAETGHHHTKVLLTVTDIKKL